MITARYKPSGNRNDTIDRSQYDSMKKRLDKTGIITMVYGGSESDIYLVDIPNPNGVTGNIILHKPEYIPPVDCDGPIRVITRNRKNQLKLFSLLEGILNISLEEIK